VPLREGEGPAAPKLTKAQQAELLLQKVDTVGQRCKPGAQIQSVISVGMLSEGWDAKTVTHIMGLRAFTSQLLCEQVVGRGVPILDSIRPARSRSSSAGAVPKPDSPRAP
jgi:type III restriction enzyme